MLDEILHFKCFIYCGHTHIQICHFPFVGIMLTIIHKIKNFDMNSECEAPHIGSLLFLYFNILVYNINTFHLFLYLLSQL